MPARTGRGETAALRRWATFSGIALVVLIVAADSYEGWQDYRRVFSDNEHIEAALSAAVTEQTARLIQEADIVLGDIAQWLTSAQGTAASAEAISARLNAKIVILPFVSSAAVADAAGILRASTRGEDAALRSLKDLEVFTVPAQAGGDSLYIDRPVGGEGSDSQTFALSRAVVLADGKFNGIVVARVAFAYLAGFYARVNVSPDTSIRLARMDGITLAEYPRLNRGGDRGRAAPADLSPASEQVRRVTWQGRERLEVSKKISGYPIVVTVSRSLASVLQPWIEEERSSAARTLTLAVLATLLLMALRSALYRQERADDERHKLEQELATVQRVEAVGFLAASVAHDFNNVLTAIVGYAELLREMVELEPAILTNVDRLLAAADRARLLVRRVLTFDSRRGLTYGPTALAPLVEEVSQQIRATLPPSVELQVVGLNHAAAVFGDATEIYQVLMNLCSNAVHAMPSGGTLLIDMQSLEVRARQVLDLGELRPGRWLCVSIADSGIGLAEEQIMSIFEPFYTTRQPMHGTGIGLTVVRNIVLRTNGALKVESRLGSGTRMSVYWPTVATPAAVPRTTSLNTAGSGQTVMVVDDEQELVVLTEELLASLGYEPVGFSDGRAALEAFRHDPERFDAILTDERMAPLPGLEFAKTVHKIRPGLPIILMTGHRDAEIDQKAKAAGIVEILDKPLRVQTLRAALSEQLRAAKS